VRILLRLTLITICISFSYAADVTNTINAATVRDQELQFLGQASLDKGKELYSQGRYSEALQHFSNAVAQNPNLSEAAEYRLLCQKQLNNPTYYAEVITSSLSDQQSALMKDQAAQVEVRLAEVEKLLAQASNPDSSLSREDQIARSIAILQRADPILQQAQSSIYSSSMSSNAQSVLRARADSLSDAVRLKRESLTAQRTAEQAAFAQKTVSDTAKSTGDTERKVIQQLYAEANHLYSQRKYKECIAVCDRIIEKDRNHQPARKLRDDASAMHSRVDDVAAINGYNANRDEHEIESIRSGIITPDIIKYPNDWFEKAARSRQNQVSSQMSVAERDARDRLERTVITREFSDQELSDVLDDLSSVTGVTILAHRDLSDITITFPAPNMSVYRILEWICLIKELSISFQDDAYFLQRGNIAEKDYSFQIYSIADLIMPIQNFVAPDVYDGDLSLSVQTIEPPNENDLVEQIKRIIAPTTWDNPATIVVYNDHLIVSQTHSVHQQIAQYLKQLREVDNQQVLVRGYFLELTDNAAEAIGIQWGGSSRQDNYFDPMFNMNGDQVGAPKRSIRTNLNVGAPGGSFVPSYGSPYGSAILRSSSGNPSGLHLNLAGSNYTNRRGGYINTLGESIPVVNQLLNGLQINATIDAVRHTQKGSVLHEPKLLVPNTRNAYVVIRSETSYVSGYTLSDDYLQPTIDRYYQGITWDVRPVISYDKKYITIRTRPRITQLAREGLPPMTLRVAAAGTSTAGTTVYRLWAVTIETPNIERIEFESHGTVPNGGALLIGGQIYDSRRESVNGVPFLSSIPGVGRLFRTQVKSHENRNRIIVIQAQSIDLQ